MSVPTSEREARADDPLEVEDALATIWAEVLGLSATEVPHDVDFLRLGGDSVLAVRMSALVRRRLAVALELADVRVETTVAELARLVRLRALEAVGADTGRALPVEVDRRDDPGAPFALLPLQQGYFVGQQDGWELSYDSAHYYVDYPLVGIDGDDAAVALADALERLAHRQPTLRGRVTAEGEQYVLAPDAPGALPGLTVTDLRDAEDALVAATVNGLRDGMSTTGPDPVTGPGLDLRLTLLPGDRGLLHAAFSLLLFDGWSTGVLTRELLALAADWNAVLDTLEIDLGDYVTALDRLGEGRAVADDRRWWHDRLGDLPAPPALALRADPRDVVPRLMAHREHRLAPPAWAALRASCTAHGVTPAAALMTAFTVVLARVAGHRRLLLNTLQANRLPLHPDVHRIVGGFASTMLLPVEPALDRSFADLAHDVQDTFGEHAAHNLVSGVEVARELGRRRGTRRPVGPVVFQSTIGMDAAIGDPLPQDAGPLGRIAVGEYVHHLRTPQVALEVRCFEIDETMVVVVSLVEELVEPAAAETLVAELQAMVDRLAAGPGWDDVPDLPDALDPDADDAGLRLGQLPEPVTPQAPGPPADDVEQAVADVFEEVLEVPVLDRALDFFALGGDSLLVVRALARLARSFDPAPSLRAFLADPTVAGVASTVRAA